MSNHPHIPAEQFWRSSTYATLGNLLALPPTIETLDRLGQIETENRAADKAQPPLSTAWIHLARTAKVSELTCLTEQFHTLFIGVTRGELMPYGSWYQTGFLMEKPLAKLRKDLQRLNIQRQSTVREPEDHAAALCEVMSLLISKNVNSQKTFFTTHIESWMSPFFQDLESVGHSPFYSAVGRLGRTFLDVESQYYSLSN